LPVFPDPHPPVPRAFAQISALAKELLAVTAIFSLFALFSTWSGVPVEELAG
jgi:LytS/YehU family sensor histidine kinase